MLWLHLALLLRYRIDVMLLDIMKVMRKLFRCSLFPALGILLFFGDLQGQSDLSSLNLSPTQLAEYQQMDPATRQSLLGRVRGEKAKSTVTNYGFQRDDIDQSDMIDDNARIVSNEPGRNVIVLKDDVDVTDEEVEEELELFGYDIFDSGNLFKPSIQLPIPVDYILGPGDSIVVQLYGKLESSNTLTVTREGNIMLSGVGDINVSGLTFLEAKSVILHEVQQKLIGVNASITMGELRSIRIFIMGEVNQPGSYSVSSLATITNALFSCGGIRKSGSLRHIQLKRKGSLVGEMDLYSLLLEGDNSNDLRLQPGDVILIPPIGRTASVSGNVIRPAIYELNSDVSVRGLVDLAGGFNSDAYIGRSTLYRIDRGSRMRTVLNLDLTSSDIDMLVRSGDKLVVTPIIDQVFGKVSLGGAVVQPKDMQWFDGMCIGDLVDSVDNLTEDADLLYVLIKRRDPVNGQIKVLSTRLDRVFEDRNSVYNTPLKAQDSVIVLSNKKLDEPLPIDSDGVEVDIDPKIAKKALDKKAEEEAESYELDEELDLKNTKQEKASLAEEQKVASSQDGFFDPGNQYYSYLPGEELEEFEGTLLYYDREVVINDLLLRLKIQEGTQLVRNRVKISGNVYFNGEYPYSDDMCVIDLLRAAHGYKEKTDKQYAIIKHVDSRTGVVSIDDVRLPDSLDDLDSVYNLRLNKGDELIVFDLFSDRTEVLDGLVQELKNQSNPIDLPELVKVTGRVKHTGIYPLSKGMKVSDLLRASGGFMAGAYTLEAELTHNNIRHGRSFSVSHENLDLAAILNGDVAADYELKPYDHLMIRPIPDWAEEISVEVKGEVFFPGVYKVRKGETLLQLIERAGGFTDQADPSGSIFIRETLRNKEQVQLDRLKARLKANLAAASFEVSKAKDAKSAEYTTLLLDQLESTEAVGRMVLDLPELMRHADGQDSLVLKDGDMLYIPQPQQEVMVLGEVLLPTSHLYQKGLDYEDYINLSGGTSSRADLERIYIIKSNGAVIPVESKSRWFSSSVMVEPGDSVVVPFNVDYMSPLPLWKEVTSIIYNLAVSAAAIASF
jgi:protein involved in polysaccharide export with SLBB domain